MFNGLFFEILDFTIGVTHVMMKKMRTRETNRLMSSTTENYIYYKTAHRA